MRKRIIIALGIIALFAFPADAAESVSPTDSTAGSSVDESDRVPSIFFPSARAGIDAAGYFRNQSDFSAEQTGFIEIGIARYRGLSFHLSLKARTIYGGKEYPRSKPWTIEYVPMEFLRARYDTGFGYLGMLLDHECYNGIDRDVDKADRYRWYGLAFRWDSPAFIPSPGRYSLARDGVLNPADALHYSLYAGRALKTVAYPYEYRFQTDIRYDIAKAGPFVPYLKGHADVITSQDRTRVNRSGEAGIMIFSERAVLAPYVRYSYRNDIDRFDGRSAGFVTAGAWCESAFDAEDAPQPQRGVTTSFRFFPGMHFMTSYGRHFFNDTYGNVAVCDVALDILRAGSVTFFGECDLNHNSPEPIYFMYPAFINYANTVGFSFAPDYADTVLSGGYSLVHRHLGDLDNRYPVKYRDLFVMIESALMNRARRFEKLRVARDSNSGAIGWRIRIGRCFKRVNDPYAWKITGTAEWAFAPKFGLVPYAAPEISFMYGTRHDMNESIETGVHYMNGILITLFLRYENTLLPGDGSPNREQSVYAGIRGEL